MITEFCCQCGFRTVDAQAARTHLNRCVFCKAPSPKEKLVPITILVEALEEMNHIITEALKRYYKAVQKDDSSRD